MELPPQSQQPLTRDVSRCPARLEVSNDRAWVTSAAVTRSGKAVEAATIRAKSSSLTSPSISADLTESAFGPAPRGRA